MTIPNRWVIIEINAKGEILHKVFATWSGGYLDGDSWKLNSGINKTFYSEDGYEFQGYSGSNYVCSKDSYGIAGSSNYSVLNNLLKKLNSREGVTAEVLDEEKFINHFGYTE